eukprot:3463267-Rhodomonas_salina.1
MAMALCANVVVWEMVCGRHQPVCAVLGVGLWLLQVASKAPPGRDQPYMRGRGERTHAVLCAACPELTAVFGCRGVISCSTAKVMMAVIVPEDPELEQPILVRGDWQQSDRMGVVRGRGGAG